jgi:predicted MFS family arabinose efflux permease
VIAIERGAVMISVWSFLIAPWIKPEKTRLPITRALALVAEEFFLVPHASDMEFMLRLIGAIAASAKILSPFVIRWSRGEAGNPQGVAFGKQTSAARLGATLGSAAGGLE